MKSNLMLKKFSTNSVPGTMSQKELRPFFGGKIIYSENDIFVNNDTISFSQVTDQYNYGYQYFDVNVIPEGWETQFSENLTDLKNNNQRITLLNQSTSNLSNNTRWQITIDGAKILKDYLFFKIKDARVFKVINYNEVYSNDINNAIYEYINYNIFSRYRLNSIDLYVNYYDITQQDIYSNIKLQYRPTFNPEVYKPENLTNMNVVGYNPYKFDVINIQYNQSKPSSQYSFDYYFDLNFTKI